MPRWVMSVTLMFVASTMGCVQRRPVVAQSDATSAPRLISCAEGLSLDGLRSHTSVQLRFTVNTEGRVDPGSLRLVPNLNASSTPESVVALAKDAALSCVYAPAMRGGQAVAMSVTRWFRVEASEVSVRRQ